MIEGVAEQVHRRFGLYAMRHGTPAPPRRVVETVPPLASATDGETDCWTHAREHAKKTGARYYEGVCLRPGREGAVSVHAWCERDTPFGPVVVELTEGYEQAYDYRGFEVDPNSSEADYATDNDRCYSVVQVFSLFCEGDIGAAITMTAPAGEVR